MRTSALALLLLGAVLLLAAGAPVQAQGRAAPVQSRSGGDPDPAFVTDASAVEDLTAAGFLPLDEEQGETSLVSDGGSTDDFGIVANATGNYTRLKYSGTAISSYRTQPIATSGALALACGSGYVAPAFLGAYLGVGSSFFSKAFACGRCIRVQCDDQLCEKPGTSIVAQIVDQCGDCLDADIALAIPAFANLTGKDASSTPAILEVSWDIEDCTPFINGTIKMLVKPGGHAYYQSFNFANYIVPITAVQLNGERLRHSTSHSWDWNPGKAINPRGPFELALLGSNKQVLRVRFSQLRSQDLMVQFKPASA